MERYYINVTTSSEESLIKEYCKNVNIGNRLGVKREEARIILNNVNSFCRSYSAEVAKYIKMLERADRYVETIRRFQRNLDCYNGQLIDVNDIKNKSDEWIKFLESSKNIRNKLKKLEEALNNILNKVEKERSNIQRLSIDEYLDIQGIPFF